MHDSTMREGAPDDSDLARWDPLEAARRLAPSVQAAADEADAIRELPPEIANEIAEAGMFRALVPRSLGGWELELPTYVNVLECLAMADGSIAWCVNQGAVFATNSAFLPRETAAEIWADRCMVVANGPSPTAEAEPVEGGYRVNGRWAFSSGICHAPWLAGLCFIVEGGERKLTPAGVPVIRHMFFPKSVARIEDTWQVQGLRATGSHHFAVEDLFVPHERTVWTYGDPALEPGPLYAYPMVLLFACGFSAIAIGIARSALDWLIEFANAKKPRGAADVLREQAMVQMMVGRAEATLRSARAYHRETVGAVWESVTASGEISLDQRVQLRMATTHCIRLATEVVDIAYNACGSDAIYASSPVQRKFQDLHVITQHLQGRLVHYESVGRHFLGLKPDLRWL